MKTLRSITAIWIFTLIFTGLGSPELHAQNTPGQLYEKALIAEEVQGDLTTAITLYRQVLNENPDNRTLAAQALLHMGICYEKQGSEQARQAYRDVINMYSDQEEEAVLAKKRIRHLETYVAELNAKAKQHIKQGNELFKVWEYEDAIREYENAIKLRPHTLLAMNAQYCIGQSWYRAGKYDEALATLTNLIEENPRSTIAPVTELMVSQVEYAMQHSEKPESVETNADEDMLVDPETGITYRKIKTFTGKNDWIDYTTGGFNISPDGRFLVLENKVVPVDGQEPFHLLEPGALRANYSPDMKKVSFIADSSIWVVPVSPITGKTVGKPRQLIHGSYRYQSPLSWSPDGNYLIFERRDETIKGDIWTIRVSDGKMEPVISSPEYEGHPIWSPDGNIIVYRKEGDLCLFSLLEGTSKKLASNIGPDHWSPDGQWLFDTDWKNSHFYSMEKESRYTFDYPQQVGRLVSFSPDGKKVLFYKCSSDDHWGLKVVSTSGGPSFTPAMGCPVYGARWSGNNKYILAQSEDDKENVIFRIVPITGEKPEPVSIEFEEEGAPFPFDASPDLTKIAFTVEKEEGKEDIYVAPFSMEDGKTTGAARKVFSDWSGGAFNVTISWSSDGKKLAILHEGNIWICPTESGEAQQLTHSPVNKRWVEWSPDGNMLSFTKFSGKTGVLCTVPTSGGSPSEIYQDCEGAHWSPDSKSLALIAGDKLKLISSDGTIIKNIISKEDLDLAFFYTVPRYSPDGNYLAFIGYQDDEKNLILKYSLDDEQISKLTDDNLDELKYAIRWSPDGKWISYLTEESVKVRPEGTLWEADFDEVIEKLFQ